MRGRKYHYRSDGRKKTIDGIEYRHVDSDLGDLWVSARGDVITRGYPRGGNFGVPACGGYMKVGLGKRKVSVHILVYELFVGRIPDGKDIDHINGNPKDNRVENLRVASKSENMRNPVTTARLKKLLHRFQPLAAKAVMRPVYGVRVFDGEKIGPFESLTAAERAVGVDHQSSAHAASHYRRRQTAGGYRWYYV